MEEEGRRLILLQRLQSNMNIEQSPGVLSKNHLRKSYGVFDSCLQYSGYQYVCTSCKVRITFIVASLLFVYKLFTATFQI